MGFQFKTFKIRMSEKFSVEGINVKTTRKIAEGGFAVVFECKDDRNRTFALKKSFFLEQVNYFVCLKLYFLLNNLFQSGST